MPGLLRVNCPCCGAKLNAEIRVGNVIEAAYESGDNGINEVAQQKKLAEQSLMEKGAGLLQAAKDLGVFEAFNAALEATKKHIPLNRDLYFLKWMTKASKKGAPQIALRQAIPDGEKIGRLEAWGFQDTVAILSNGEFKLFTPVALIHGQPIEVLEVTKNGIEPVQTLTWDIWVRTKFGYVERSGEFAAEMQKYSIGSFSS